jgi:hypothetical protein
MFDIWVFIFGKCMAWNEYTRKCFNQIARSGILDSYVALKSMYIARAWLSLSRLHIYS